MQVRHERQCSPNDVRNHSFHLRGNVYVMYKTEEAAKRAYDAFNGRFYAGISGLCGFTYPLRKEVDPTI